MTPVPVVYLKSGHDRRLKTGHPWVFSNELTDIPATIPSGSIVEVRASRGRSHGLGLFNPTSLIAVRLLFVDTISDPVSFLAERIQSAVDLRRRVLPGEGCTRLVFGESDFLPGLVVDQYASFLTLQILSAGMERWKPALVEALLQVLPDTTGILARNRSHNRELEGLPQSDEILYGTIPDDLAITEGGIRYTISLTSGQKTGFFLDQKLNRQAIRSVVSGQSVLDCFCNQGGFALHAAAAGASRVLGIDLSDTAIQQCEQNARLNGLTASFRTADVFDFLKQEVAASHTWDVIILDPPGFTKSRKNVPAARKGYAEINTNALRLIPSGGFLVTASCSQHIYEETFLEIVRESAIETGRQLRQVFRGQQAPDHPILESMPETRYLKFFIYQVF